MGARMQHPLLVVKTYDATDSPVVQTLIWSYTPPAGRVARCVLISSEIICVTAPATPAFERTIVEFVGGDAGITLETYKTLAAIGDRAAQYFMGAGPLLTHTLTVATSRASTSSGGTMRRICTGVFIEFDAEGEIDE